MRRNPLLQINITNFSLFRNFKLNIRPRIVVKYTKVKFFENNRDVNVNLNKLLWLQVVLISLVMIKCGLISFLSLYA